MQTRSENEVRAFFESAGATNNMFATTPDELLALTRGKEADLARDP